MTRTPPARAAAVVFALFVVAVAVASVATQRLKRSDPIVERVFFHQWISPNGDGRKDSVRLRFDLPRADRVTVTLVDERGDPVRTLADDRRLGKGTQPFEWDGRTDDGLRAPDGVYRMRVGLRDEGRAVTAPRRLRLDTTPPRMRMIAATPPTIVPGFDGGRGRARVRFRGPSNPVPLVRVWRTDQGRPREVARFEGRRGRSTAEWDGSVVAGRLPECGRRACPPRTGTRRAPDGSYVVSVTGYDKAGNAGTTHPLPPRPGAARSGVTVRYITLTGPLDPVRTGAVARFEVGPTPRRVGWRLLAAATRREVADGSGSGSAFAVRVPRDAAPGLYLVVAEAPGRRASWPVVVRRPGRARLLAVVPVMTWQGETAADADRDGFPDTLAGGKEVPVPRPFAGGAVEQRRLSESAPLLRFLERSRVRFDVTTDYAMARASGPDYRAAAGVVFAGSARWLTEELDLELRRYVERGGRIASFGADAFRRTVTLEPGLLADPSRPEALNLFGERTREITIPPAPLVVSGDQLDLFARTDGFVGLFARFEQQERLVGGAELVAEAGRDADRPAVVAYRLGRGLVVRFGVPEWADALNRSSEVAAVTRRLWTILSE